jgi:hypothetical protein
MAILSKKTIQRLAALHALALWRRGAYGPVRLQKTLFFADKDNPAGWRLFTFKKYYLGQFSDELADSLNDLREMGRVKSRYDGPSERLTANIPVLARGRIKHFFCEYFPTWHAALQKAFQQIAYLSNDAVLAMAHEDPTYKTSQHGQVIFTSFKCPSVEFTDLSDETAEALSDLVDTRLHHALSRRLKEAVQRPAKGENWREIYFAGR